MIQIEYKYDKCTNRTSKINMEYFNEMTMLTLMHVYYNRV